MRRVPVAVVASVDPVLRDALCLGAVCDRSDLVVVRHELDGTAGRMRRLVYDGTGAVEDRTLLLEHPCLGCALVEDILPTVERLASSGRWQGTVLALPLATTPDRAVAGIAGAAATVVASAVTLVDAANLVGDLFGDDLLAERGVQSGADDRRSVGEVVARQVEYADTVFAVHSPDGGSMVQRLLGQLVGERVVALPGLEHADVGGLFEGTHDGRAAQRRIDPWYVRPMGPADGAPGELPWTADLRSRRPFHPDRLRSNLSRLGVGRLRGRGRFWLPTRPDAVCGWDGAGGQLSVGTVGDWQGTVQSTRLVITGLDDVEAGVREAFADSLLTDAELARGWSYWRGHDDGFSPWLDSGSQAA